MGMFDYVKHEADCPNCKSLLGDFQTKDSGCFLDTVEPSDIDNFYTKCDGCGAWVEFNVNRVCTVSSINISHRLDGEWFHDDKEDDE